MLVRHLCSICFMGFLAVSFAPAQTIVYTTSLSGANQDPPVASMGTGASTVTLDLAASTLRVEAMFSGLTGNTTVAHIHCCTTTPFAGNVGVASPTPTFPGFPAGVTSGAYDQTFDLTDTSSYSANFVSANGGTAAGAMAALMQGLDEGRAYLNIHSSFAPGGEIRGFYVPEPATGSWLMLGLLAALRRLKR